MSFAVLKTPPVACCGGQKSPRPARQREIQSTHTHRRAAPRPGAQSLAHPAREAILVLGVVLQRALLAEVVLAPRHHGVLRLLRGGRVVPPPSQSARSLRSGRAGRSRGEAKARRRAHRPRQPADEAREGEVVLDLLLLFLRVTPQRRRRERRASARQCAATGRETGP